MNEPLDYQLPDPKDDREAIIINALRSSIEKAEGLEDRINNLEKRLEEIENVQ